MSKIQIAEDGSLSIENARLIWRNFAGESSKFNRAGQRNFSILFEDPVIARRLLEEGWNVKEKEPLEDGDPVFYHIPVTVSFEVAPPSVWLISGNRKSLLNEKSVSVIDGIDIGTADIVLRPYDWSVNGKTGRKAYLKTAYIVQNQDAFSAKYASYECEV